MAKWPNVPSVFGWLSLDRRGQWLLKGERVANPGIAEFFGRNYSHDDNGRWFLQNGPQRVFVALDYTPFVYRVTSAGAAQLALIAHSGGAAGEIRSAYVDDNGRMLLETSLGIGLVHDLDLELLIPHFRDHGGMTPDETALDAAFDALQAGRDPQLLLTTGSTGTAIIPVRPIRAADVPVRFGFIARPLQPEGQEECY